MTNDTKLKKNPAAVGVGVWLGGLKVRGAGEDADGGGEEGKWCAVAGALVKKKKNALEYY